jgi:hypothetical protein
MTMQLTVRIALLGSAGRTGTTEHDIDRTVQRPQTQNTSCERALGRALAMPLAEGDGSSGSLAGTAQLLLRFVAREVLCVVVVEVALVVDPLDPS